MTTSLLLPASLALPFSAFSFGYFYGPCPSLVMEDGPCLVLLVFYQTLFFSIRSEFKNGIHQPKFNNQHFNLSTELIIYNTYNAVFS